MKLPTVHLSVVVTATPGINDGYGARCLETLFATSDGAPYTLRVTLTENHPGSGVGQGLKARFPAIELIENPERRGYAANHNAALRHSDAEYLVVANDDLEFLPETLRSAVAFMNDPANARVGVVGFNLRNPDGSLQPSTYSFPTVFRALLDVSNTRRFLGHSSVTRRVARLLGRGAGRSTFWAHDRTVPVDTFRGALVLVRASAAREVGFMSEATRLGGEEADWNRRFWNAGWQVVFLHSAPVIHYGGATHESDPAMRVEYLKGWLHYFRTHGRPGAYLAFRVGARTAYRLRALVHTVRGDRRLADLMRQSLVVVKNWPVRRGAGNPLTG